VSAATPDGQRTLEVLGFTRNGRSGVTQVLQSENTFTVAGGANAGTGTLLSALEVTGNPLGIATGDTVTLQGRRGDGSVVNLSFAVGAGDTLQSLVNKLNDGTSGFGAGSRTATASLSNGQIVLTDSTAGDSQLTLAMSVTATGGGVINLGRVNVATVGRLREVVAGTDAAVKVDGVVIRRAGNTVSDAIAGLTLNLQQSEVGIATTLVVDRDADAIAKSVGEVATAYNEMLKFRTEQAKVGAPLHNDSTLRASMSSLTNTLLGTVTGATGGITSASLAGLSLQKEGTLLLDTSVFKAKLASNFSDVVNLFSTSGAASNAAVSYFFSTDKTVPGTYAVDVTTAAAVATITGAGFSGTYADDATADTMTITDASTGVSGNIALANGDTVDTILGKLNAMFAANKMNLSASKSGNDLVLSGTQYGSASTFTVAYAAGGADGSAQLGLAAATYAGVDIVGTIGGFAAVGAGQVLTASAGSAAEGLAVRYTGAVTGAQGTITFILGVSGALFNTADIIARQGGAITTQQDALQRRITDLQTRADTVQQALDRKRQALVKQFSEMERSLGRIQQQGAALSGFIASLNASNSR
jgi:flagellar hook-associated protein 2